LNRYPATYDAIKTMFQFPRPFSDSLSDKLRWLHAVEIDLDRNLHCAFSLSTFGRHPSVARCAAFATAQT
jgi:hypothetical protein